MAQERKKESVDVRAKSVDEAIAKGLAQLNKTREEVEIEILNPGSRGVLGIGAEEAVVRMVFIEPPTPAPAPAPEPEPEPAPKPEPAEGPPPPEISVTQSAREVLTELLKHMGIKAQVVISPPKGIMAEDRDMPPVILDITGDDLGILIGRRGETLNALQYVTRLIVSRQTKYWVNIIVDVEEYKVRRERSLRQLAQRMADRVAASGKAVTLEAMPAYERRIVHVTLRDNEAVTTKSVGEGTSRKVMILPKS